MNLLALAFHTACDCLETLWEQARSAVGASMRFIPDLHTIVNNVVTGKAAPILNCWMGAISEFNIPYGDARRLRDPFLYVALVAQKERVPIGGVLPLQRAKLS